MSFDSLLTHTIDIYRSQQGLGVVTSYGDNPWNSGVACLIQPISAEFASKTDMNFGRSYNCMVDLGTDISISDRVIDQDGKVYQVSGTLNRGYGSSAVQHLTVLLTEEVTEGPDA